MKAKIGNRLLATLKPEDKPFEVTDTDLPGFILRVQPTGVMTYYASYYLQDGRRNRMKIGRSTVFTPAQARDEAKVIIADATMGADPMAARRAAKADNLGEYLTHEYGPWVEANRKTGKATLARLRAAFSEFLPKKLPDLTPWLLEKWRSSRLKAGIKPSTINRDLAALKSAINRAVEWGILEVSPLGKVKPSKVDRKPKVRYLDEGEEGKLRDALCRRDERIRAERDTANEWRKQRGYRMLPDLRRLPYPDHLSPMVILSINTGLRRGELFNLKWADVHLGKNPTLTVEGDSAKSGTTRHIPLNDEALSALTAWRKTCQKKDGLVFPGKDGAPMDNVKKSWANLLSDAKIRGFRWHDMRHHFASMLVMAGVDLNTVRELMGHSDIKMTLRYAHLAPEHKAAAVAVLVNRRPSKSGEMAIG